MNDFIHYIDLREKRFTIKTAQWIMIGGNEVYDYIKYYFCIMIDYASMTLAQVVLPREVLDNFDVVKVESSSTEIQIHLDEKIPVSLKGDVHFESKGFIPVVSITDFPIRDHKVILMIRRRKWLDIRTGKSFILPFKIAAEGTRYSKEFGDFLKETYGQIPSDLPYA